MKNQYKTYDFIASDLIITDIKNIYWAEVQNWTRPVPAPRYANGLVLVTGGRIDYTFGGVNISSGRGDVLFFPKGIPYSGIKRSNEPNSYYVVDFDTRDEDDCVHFPLPLVFHASDYKRIEAEFINVLSRWRSKDNASHLKCRAKIYSLLALLIEDYSGSSTCKNQLGIFPDIADYISKNFTNPRLNVANICKTFYISESQLRRLFRKALNQSPLEYIQSMRLGLAKSMLSGSNGAISMEEIAYSCGFSSLPYFSRLFKKYVGIPPSKYKEI